MGFFMACRGAFATFLYNDPTDNTVLGQVIGTGNGVSTTAQLVRTFGVPGIANFTEPMTAISAVYAIYYNGISTARDELVRRPLDRPCHLYRAGRLRRRDHGGFFLLVPLPLHERRLHLREFHVPAVEVAEARFHLVLP